MQIIEFPQTEKVKTSVKKINKSFNSEGHELVVALDPEHPVQWIEIGPHITL